METKTYVEKLYEMLKAQPHDPSWLISVAELLDIQVEILQAPKWFFKYWEPSWGKIELANTDKNKMLIWERTDGQKPLVDLTPEDKIPFNVQAARLALMAELVLVLPEINQLSFVTVGHPDSWRNCEILVNGKKMEKVISADAILGTCEVYLTEKGKLVPDHVKGEFAKTQVTGNVQILVKPDSQSIF